MRTAVIVSGALRHLLNASSSWRFAADYYLITDNTVYSAQSRTAEDIVAPQLSYILSQSTVKYAGVYLQIAEHNKVPYQYLSLDPALSTHPVVNMAWKWRTAYMLLQQQAVHYDRVLLLRPDLYVWYTQSETVFDNLRPELRTILSPGDIFQDTVQDRPTMGDVFLLVDLDSFRILAGFFDYFLNNYLLILNQGYDLHSLFAKYVVEQGLTVSGKMSEYCLFAVLRDNTKQMFNQNHKLSPEYSFSQLQDQQQLWWREKYQ